MKKKKKKKKNAAVLEAAREARQIARKKKSRAKSRAARFGAKLPRVQALNWTERRSNAAKMQSSASFVSGFWSDTSRNGRLSRRSISGKSKESLDWSPISEDDEQCASDLQPPLLLPAATELVQNVWDAIVPFQNKTNGLADAVKEVRSLLIASCTLINSHSSILVQC